MKKFASALLLCLWTYLNADVTKLDYNSEEAHEQIIKSIDNLEPVVVINDPHNTYKNFDEEVYSRIEKIFYKYEMDPFPYTEGEKDPAVFATFITIDPEFILIEAELLDDAIYTNSGVYTQGTVWKDHCIIHNDQKSKLKTKKSILEIVERFTKEFVHGFIMLKDPK